VFSTTPERASFLIIPASTTTKENTMTLNLLSQLAPGVARAGEGESLNVFGHTLTFKHRAEELNDAALLWELSSPPGTMVPPHLHAVEDEFIFVAEGELEVMIGGETHTARAGDLIKMPRGVPHGIWQKGAATTRTLWAVIPAGKMESLFRALGALPANQPPDPARVGQIFAEHDLTLLPPPGL
jgi:quercetin dioxygenase-like cupin family protein